jgi:hypothetical protein
MVQVFRPICSVGDVGSCSGPHHPRLSTMCFNFPKVFLNISRIYLLYLCYSKFTIIMPDVTSMQTTKYFHTMLLDVRSTNSKCEKLLHGQSVTLAAWGHIINGLLL